MLDKDQAERIVRHVVMLSFPSSESILIPTAHVDSLMDTIDDGGTC